MLGITINELNELIHEYENSIPRWDYKKIADALRAFAKQHKRWPRGKEWGPNHKLPSLHTFARWGAWRIIQNSFSIRDLTPQLILSIPNVTVRAQLTAEYGGYEKMVEDGGGTLRQQDDYGKLWELPPEPDITEDVALYLEVENSTVIDGKREHFFLRVPPTMKSAKQAVEWSFGIQQGTLEEFAAQT